MLLAPRRDELGYEGRGDFVMDAEGRLRRRGEREVAPFVYAGVAIVKPELFATRPTAPSRSTSSSTAPSKPAGCYGVAPRRPVAACRRTPEAIAGAEGAPRRAARAEARWHPRAARLHDPARRALPADAGRRAARRPALRGAAATRRRSPSHRSICRPAGPRGPSPRSLAERGGGRAQLLPRIVPLGEADEAEFDLSRAPIARSDRGLAPPIPPLERRLILTRLVQRWSAEVDRDLLRLAPGDPVPGAGVARRRGATSRATSKP